MMNTQHTATNCPFRFPRSAHAMLGPVLTATGMAVPLPAAASEKPETFVEGGITIDALANQSGGQRRGSRVLGLASVGAGVNDLGSGSLKVSGFVELQIAEGSGFSESVVGDGQVVSNIEAVPGIRPSEAWLELGAAAGRHRIKVGLVDLNREFDMQQVGSMFLNSSHGIGPELSQSGANGPSIFPTTTTAVVYGFEAERWGARVGAFNAVAGDPANPKKTVVPFPGEDGLLLIAEAEHRSESVRTYAGLWAYSTASSYLLHPDDAADDQWRSRGAYAAIETTLATTPTGEKLESWVRVGVANEKVLPVSTYLGGGVRYGTDDRGIGFAIAHARLGDPAIDAAAISGGSARRAETNFELSYVHALTPAVTVQPDIQYVRNPGWDPALDDALVIGLRLSVGFR
ncbi:carbohydrate porin [Pelagerythrobacter rhizovicinus]|uniref:Carbohydrate porin n=1 Tax=Pelagerythrobacter rhizovicinus TaxID=2268576 RepID=A0A4Q2KRS8_9SPHN|nr:carbohydrate porin [Pelagerythrobacter rhizovicinus]RXZ66383.1 carbohydrate porin [Pelagerythrobacter rhizovicinus]